MARRVLAGLLLSLGLMLALGRGAPEPSRPALVAVTDVAAGELVIEGAVRVVERPASTVPAAALDDADHVVGRLATVAISEGEVLTDARMLAGDGGATGPDRRLVTVPLLGAARSVSVGDRVDVYRPGRREPVAEDARVVAVPDDGDDLSVTSEPTAVLALPAAAAGDIVDALGSDATTGFVLTTRSASTGP